MPQENNKEILISKVKRKIDPAVRVLLFAVAAGRCEVCNKSVIKDLFTNKDIIWGEIAHIYAFHEGGARAKKDKLHDNDIRNLLLACPDCHEKIDKNGLAKYYSPEYLKRAKIEHEQRVRTATSFGNNRQTKILKMLANISNEIVKVGDGDIVNALMSEKLCPCEDKFEEIDYTSVSGLGNGAYWRSKMQEIEQKLNKFHSDLERNKIDHVSIFAIGPIPLLICLGWKLNNKVKTKIFQRHRDGESWAWNKGTAIAKYDFRIVNKGKRVEKVALLLSLSGSIDKNLLPEAVKKDYYVYELSVKPTPNYNFLRTEKDLFNFEKEYTTAVSFIKSKHKGLKSIELFPAIPAPVAVVCGRSLNKNADPSLKIFNSFNKNKFKYIFTINNKKHGK